MTNYATQSGATDVPEFLSDLDGGQFERLLGAVLSQVAAACVDREKQGEVSIALKIKPIKGTHQVEVLHKLAFTRPTETGKASEDSERITVLYVGKGGAMSLAQAQLSFDQAPAR